MNKKKKVLLPLCISVVVLYIFLSARSLGKELHFIPRWTIDVSRPIAEKDQPPAESFAEAIPFKLGQMLGYFTEDGTVLKNTTFDYKAAISTQHYAPYGTHTEPIPFYNRDGTLAGKIAGTGFPFFTEYGNYLFLPGGASFARLGDDGTILWKYEAYAPITAFAAAEAGCVAGLADGTVISFGIDGGIDQQFSPDGSNYPVILGVALSADGDMIACVCGQERQRFVLAKRQNGHTEIIHHEYLAASVTRQVPVMFSKDGKIVYYDSADGLGIVRTDARKSSHVAFNGKVLSMKEADHDGTVFVLSRNGSECSVSILQPFDTYAGAFSFKAQSVCIAVKGSSLFVGRDGSISRIDIVEK